jgi:hypothetical protein
MSSIRNLSWPSPWRFQIPAQIHPLKRPIRNLKFRILIATTVCARWTWSCAHGGFVRARVCALLRCDPCAVRACRPWPAGLCMRTSRPPQPRIVCMAGKLRRLCPHTARARQHPPTRNHLMPTIHDARCACMHACAEHGRRAAQRAVRARRAAAARRAAPPRPCTHAWPAGCAEHSPSTPTPHPPTITSCPQHTSHNTPHARNTRCTVCMYACVRRAWQASCAARSPSTPSCSSG